jgi:hypothetical protein
MKWENILKLMTAREVLQTLSEEFGGTVQGGWSNTRISAQQSGGQKYTLVTSNNDVVVIEQKGRSQYVLKINKIFIARDFNPTVLLDKARGELRNDLV